MTFTIDSNYIGLIMCLPIIFVIILSIILLAVRKKMNVDMAKVIEETKLTVSLSEIYKQGRLLALFYSAIAIAICILSIFLFDKIYGFVATFIVMFSIIIMGLLEFMPKFLFKCPQCQSRNMTNKRQVISRATDLHEGIKLVYFNCDSCGFQKIERVVTQRDLHI